MPQTMSEPVTSDGSPIETGQPLRYRAHRARLVDQHQVGRVRGAGEVAGEVGQSDADEHDLAVAQLAGGDRGHHLGGGVVSRGSEPIVHSRRTPDRAARSRSGEPRPCRRDDTPPGRRTP